MNCPKCNRNLVPTLSICTTCGTMVKDSVREELEVKISTVPRHVKTEFRGKATMSNKPLLQPPAARASQPVMNKPTTGSSVIKNQAVNKPVTTEISSKLTSPTLVDFQPKSTALPEWRLQLQNAVRQRKEHNQPHEETATAPTIVHRTNGSAALKAEVLELERQETVLHENEKVNNALRRIEQSRKMFYVEEKPKAAPIETAPKKDFPFRIAAKNDDVPAVKTETKTSANFAPVAKPKLVSSLRADKPDFDTNKLPPLPQEAKISTSFEKRPVETPEKIETRAVEPAALEKAEETINAELPKIKISHPTEEAAEEIIEEAEEIEDCAPFAMRFNAGVFDFLIGSFASLILLAPFILLGGDWFTLAGLFAFLATNAIVMFVYMTTAIGLFGKTFGMKMFSLEIIDIEENDYPTFHQAAVSSSVYLLSLALGGTGFLTVPFTSERRAVHDIVSGTVVVREYEGE